MLGIPNLSPGDVVGGVAALVRAGVIRPLVPRPALLGLLAELPLTRPNLGTAVAFQATTQPDGVAVVDDAGMLTWAELDRRVTRLANVLHAHGQPGGCVASMLRNGREAVEVYAAGGRAGMAPVPLNTWATPGEVARILHMQRPAVVVVDQEGQEVVARAIADLHDRPVVLRTGEGGTYEPTLATASATAPFARGTGKVVIHTSGTTGAPKGAERTVGLGGLAAALGMIAKVPVRRDDRILVVPPLFHSFASGVVGVAAVIGATAILPSAFDPARFEAQVREHGVTVAALVPIMVRRVLEQPEPSTPSPLRILLTSGSAMGTALRGAAQQRWGPVVHDLYGSTEAGWVAIATPEDALRKPGSVGRPGPGVGVEVVDGEGRRLGVGEVGGLRVRTGMEFSGYTGSDGHRGAWDIGDLGYLDADGYLFVTGRRDEMIITGGENVYPSEVEAVLEGHPGISEVAVIGVDDETYGQVLRAYVVGQVTPAEVDAWLRERIARYKVPKRVVVVDGLPRTPTGKVLKRQLLRAEHPSRGPGT